MARARNGHRDSGGASGAALTLSQSAPDRVPEEEFAARAWSPHVRAGSRSRHDVRQGSVFSVGVGSSAQTDSLREVVPAHVRTHEPLEEGGVGHQRASRAWGSQSTQTLIGHLASYTTRCRARYRRASLSLHPHHRQHVFSLSEDGRCERRGGFLQRETRCGLFQWGPGEVSARTPLQKGGLERVHDNRRRSFRFDLRWMWVHITGSLSRGPNYSFVPSPDQNNLMTMSNVSSVRSLTYRALHDAHSSY